MIANRTGPTTEDHLFISIREAGCLIQTVREPDAVETFAAISAGLVSLPPAPDQNSPVKRCV